MLEWHGVPQVNYWKSSNGNSCNMVSGKDPGDLPMNIHRGDNFTAFIGQLCRKVTFNYLKEVSFLLEKTRTYKKNKQSMENLYLTKYLHFQVKTPGHTKTGTFSTYRFIPDNTSFHNPQDQPANECYCLEEKSANCLPSGLLDISGCQPGKINRNDS